MPLPEKEQTTSRAIRARYSVDTRVLIQLTGPVDRNDFDNTPGRLMAVSDSRSKDYDNDAVHKAHREAQSIPDIEMYVTRGTLLKRRV